MKGLKSHSQGILNNGTPVCVIQKLKMGDILTINIQEKASSGKLSPVCLLLIINKSSNMPIHPSVNNHNNSLVNGTAWYYRNQDSAFILHCINRLDRDAFGLTIIAKHPVNPGILSSMAPRRELHSFRLEFTHPVTGQAIQFTAPLPSDMARLIS